MTWAPISSVLLTKATSDLRNHRQPRLLPFYFGCNEKHPRRTRPTFLEYVDLKDLTQEILSRFPLATHQYVTIGRSPTPILAFMRQLKGVRVHSLRIPSGFGRIHKLLPLERDNRLKDQAAQALAHLLSELDASRKFVVLIDFCLTGATLRAVHQTVRAKIEARFPGLRVLALALAYDCLSPNFELADIPARSLHMIDLKSYRTLRRNLFCEQYDSQAEYVRDSRGHLIADRGVFKKFSQQLKECADSDRTFKGKTKKYRENVRLWT